MKSFLVSALLLAPALVLAQAAPAKSAKPAAKAQSTKTSAKAAPKKVVVAKAAARSNRAAATAGTAAAAAAAAAAVASASTSAELGPEELAVAERVHTGHIACELGASVNVTPDPKAPGRFHISGKGFAYHMTPVVSSTGAVRLEDTQRGAVWLQIANKSMLMNQKLGQRLADECMSPAQVQVAEALKTNPQPSLLDKPVDK